MQNVTLRITIKLTLSITVKNNTDHNKKCDAQNNMMLSVALKLTRLNVVIQSVVMLSVVAPVCYSTNLIRFSKSAIHF